jgi:DNA-binding transcriptional LysR family regulator
LDQLRAFVEVAEAGSFTAAAKRLNLTQPAVTHQIQELERRFKTALIERVGKRAHLTQAGQDLMEHARHLLDEDHRTHVAMRRYDDGWLGRVRIGTNMTMLMYLLPAILQRLKTRHPQLEIQVKAGFSASTIELLKTNALDLGLCAMPVSDPVLEVTPLFTDELVAILPPNSGPIPKTATPQFVSQQPLVLGSKDSALRKAITSWLERAGQPPNPIMEFDNVEAMKAIVAVGLGASIVPRLSVDAGRTPPGVTVVPLRPRAIRPVAMVRLHRKRATQGLHLVASALLELRQCKRTCGGRFPGQRGQRLRTELR